MDRAYIDQLNGAYEDFLRQPLHGVAVLPIDTNHLNFVHSREDLDFIAQRVRGALGLVPYQPELPLPGPGRASPSAERRA